MRAAALLLIACVLAWPAAGCGSPAEPPPAHVRAVVAAAVPVGSRGDAITGVAVGEGGVWVAGGGGRSGWVSRMDPGSGALVWRTRLRSVRDVAAGAGAVWALDGACCVSRIDPDSGEVLATIRLGRTGSSVAVGAGAVWVALSHSPSQGEVVRIEPRSGEIVARIPARGHPGALVVEAGAVWVLSHPDYTDETTVPGASLYRIDARTNVLAATPLHEELPFLGGLEMGPVITAGEGAVWLRSAERTYPYRTLAIHIDARTGEVARERLPVRHFSPIAVTGEGVWFAGTDGILSRLDPGTLDVDESRELGIQVADAALDRATGTLWLASLVNRRAERGHLVDVGL